MKYFAVVFLYVRSAQEVQVLGTAYHAGARRAFVPTLRYKELQVDLKDGRQPKVAACSPLNRMQV